jgi:hypothetical protein
VGESEFLPGVVSVRIPRWLHVFFWSAGTSLELALQGGQQGVRGGVEHPLEGADRRWGVALLCLFLLETSVGRAGAGYTWAGVYFQDRLWWSRAHRVLPKSVVW